VCGCAQLRADEEDVASIRDRPGTLTGLLDNAATNVTSPTASLTQRAFQAMTLTAMIRSSNTRSR